MIESSSPRRPRRVGHKGAAHIEPGNTLASFDAALRHDVDMIELDVLSASAPTAAGRCWSPTTTRTCAHGRRCASSRRSSTSPRRPSPALDSTSTSSCPGYELRVLEALREHDLVARTLVSGMFPAGLDAIRAAEPALRLGWSVPRVRRDYTTDMLTAIPAWRCSAATAPRCRAACAPRCAPGRFDAIMAHWRVVTPALVRAVARGRRRAVRVDGRRRAHDRQADRDGRRRHHHQRPAPVRCDVS